MLSSLIICSIRKEGLMLLHYMNEYEIVSCLKKVILFHLLSFALFAFPDYDTLIRTIDSKSLSILRRTERVVQN